MTFDLLSRYPERTYGFSTRAEGSMNRFTRVPERTAYFARQGMDPAQVVTADLVHGSRVTQVDRTHGGQTVPATDALITNTPGLYLSVTGADCFPLYFYDPVHHAVGLAHAGWRGVVGNIAGNTVMAMEEAFGTNPADLLCGVGPGIRVCHFSVPADRFSGYAFMHRHLHENGGVMYADLPAIITDQLRTVGLLSERVEVSGDCTYCDTTHYFSYRRDQPEELELMVAYLGVPR